MKLRATKSRDRQAEPSSRHHRLTGRVWANIRGDPDQLLRGIVQKLTCMLLNIMVNICYRPSNFQNILFVDNPNIRGYCFTKKISPLKSEILFVNLSQPNAGEDKEYINEEEILSHPKDPKCHFSHSTQSALLTNLSLPSALPALDWR